MDGFFFLMCFKFNTSRAELEYKQECLGSSDYSSSTSDGNQQQMLREKNIKANLVWPNWQYKLFSFVSWLKVVWGAFFLLSLDLFSFSLFCFWTSSVLFLNGLYTVSKDFVLSV